MRTRRLSSRGSEPRRATVRDERVITRSNSGIEEIDALAGMTVTVVATGVDSDGETYFTVLAAGREMLVYEDFVQFAPTNRS